MFKSLIVCINSESGKTIISILFLILLRLNVTCTKYITQILFLNESSFDSLGTVTDLKNTIQNSGCTIPKVQHTQHIISDHHKHLSKNNISCHKVQHSLIQKNKTHIWIVNENLRRYKVYNNSNLKCCFEDLNYILYKEEYSFESAINMEKMRDCIQFQNSTEMHNEFVRVVCTNKRKLIYNKFFIFTVKKPFTRQRKLPFNIPKNSSYNVIVLGLGSVSRVNFHRTMKRTSNFMKNKKAIEFLGYSKVGSNAFLNIMPVLVGMNSTEFNNTCWSSKMTLLDRCPYVWERFKDSGYYTAFIEDTSQLGIFYNNELGLNPTDYFLHPFNFNTNVQRQTQGISECVDYDYYHSALNYLENIISATSPLRLFALFWESSMLAHNTVMNPIINLPSAIDKDYEDFLKKLDSKGYLNDSILFIMSDRGFEYKINDKKLREQNKLEANLPIATVLVPPSFNEKYPFAYENLKANSRRLTTPFDMHATLTDLINLNAINNKEILNRTSSNYVKNRGISLFLPIPTNRTCHSAGIQQNWCSCTNKIRYKLKAIKI